MGTSNLIEWMEHRAPMCGIYNRAELSRATMTDRWTIEEIYERGSLEGVNLSTIKWIARVLFVSLQELRWLDNGELSWIPDGHIVEPEAYFTGRSDFHPLYAMRAVQRGGLPVPASIAVEGTVKVDEDWSDQDGKRLPVTFKFNRDWFGVELAPLDAEKAATYLVMRVGSVFELFPGEDAVIAYGDPWEPKYVFGRLGQTKDPEVARVSFVRGNQPPEEVRREQLVRVAKIMRRCEKPPEPERIPGEYRYEFCFDQPYAGE